MFARVTRFQASAERAAAFPNVSLMGPPPAILQEQTGFKGLMTFVNRDSGKAILVTLWERRMALDASTELATQLVDQVIRDTEGELLEPSEVYELFASMWND